jgi:hypothetical protein
MEWTTSSPYAYRPVKRQVPRELYTVKIDLWSVGAGQARSTQTARRPDFTPSPRKGRRCGG